MDRLKLHRAHYRRLGRVCLDLSLGGFTVDEGRRRDLFEAAEREKDDLRRAINQATPFDLFGKGKRKGEVGKGLSPVKVTAYFYDHLKCKPIYRKVAGRNSASRTADEEAIRRLMRSYVKARLVGQLILNWRAADKRGQFLAESRVDDDGIFRGFYVPTAVSGQLQCMENPLGTGSNNQNVPRPPSPVRTVFVPDKGHVLLELDESRIESRLLGGMSGDPRMMREAQPDWKGDEYQDIADDLDIASAFDGMFGPVTTEEDKVELKRPSVRKYYVRQTGKRTKLASGYGMRGEMMSRALLLETEGALALDPRQCDVWLDRLYDIRRGIPRYQEWIRQRMLRDGYLENSWGRRIYFRKLRITDSDYRDGYAWSCASEDRTLTNQCMVFVSRWMEKAGIDGRVVQNGHDALVLSVVPEAAYEVLCRLGERMGAERTYPGQAGEWNLACPIGYKVGASWGSMAKEWKVRPSESAFKEVLEVVLQDVWWAARKERRRA